MILQTLSKLNENHNQDTSLFKVQLSSEGRKRESKVFTGVKPKSYLHFATIGFLIVLPVSVISCLRSISEEQRVIFQQRDPTYLVPGVGFFPNNYSNNRLNMEKLVKIGKPAVPVLIKALGDEDRDLRMNAAYAFGNIADSRAVPALIKVLEDEYGDVRNAAAIALRKIKDPETVPEVNKSQ